MQERMYGVVLWTDQRDSKAVIWCEDHGNLAFYSEPSVERRNRVSLDAGDLIQFDLREDPEGRYARNLTHVDQGHAPDLPRHLRADRSHQSAKVIPFPT